MTNLLRKLVLYIGFGIFLNLSFTSMSFAVELGEYCQTDQQCQSQPGYENRKCCANDGGDICKEANSEQECPSEGDSDEVSFDLNPSQPESDSEEETYQNPYGSYVPDDSSDTYNSYGSYNDDSYGERNAPPPVSTKKLESIASDNNSTEEQRGVAAAATGIVSAGNIAAQALEGDDDEAAAGVRGATGATSALAESGVAISKILSDPKLSDRDKAIAASMKGLTGATGAATQLIAALNQAKAARSRLEGRVEPGEECRRSYECKGYTSSETQEGMKCCSGVCVEKQDTGKVTLIGQKTVFGCSYSGTMSASKGRKKSKTDDDDDESDSEEASTQQESSQSSSRSRSSSSSSGMSKSEGEVCNVSNECADYEEANGLFCAKTGKSKKSKKVCKRKTGSKSSQSSNSSNSGPKGEGDPCSDAKECTKSKKLYCGYKSGEKKGSQKYCFFHGSKGKILGKTTLSTPATSLKTEGSKCDKTKECQDYNKKGGLYCGRKNGSSKRSPKYCLRQGSQKSQSKSSGTTSVSKTASSSTTSSLKKEGRECSEHKECEDYNKKGGLYCGRKKGSSKRSPMYCLRQGSQKKSSTSSSSSSSSSSKSRRYYLNSGSSCTSNKQCKSKKCKTKKKSSSKKYCQ